MIHFIINILIIAFLYSIFLFFWGMMSPKFGQYVQDLIDNRRNFRSREKERIKQRIKEIFARKKDIEIDSRQYVKVGNAWIELQNKDEFAEKEEPRWTEYELELIDEIDDAFINYINRKCPASDGDIKVYRAFAKGEYEYNNWIKAIDECIFLTETEVKLIDEIRKTRNDIAVDFKNDFGKFYNVKLTKICRNGTENNYG